MEYTEGVRFDSLGLSPEIMRAIRRRELELLIDCVASQGGIVGEHLFQAALALSKELTRLPAP